MFETLENHFNSLMETMGVTNPEVIDIFKDIFYGGVIATSERLRSAHAQEFSSVIQEFTKYLSAANENMRDGSVTVRKLEAACRI
jgi:hypothetical protein